MDEIFVDDDTARIRDTVARLVAQHVAPIAEACD